MAELLTTRQVQDILHVDRTTIYRMVESGGLPALRVGKQWRFTRGEVERWLQASHSLHAQSAPSAQAAEEARSASDLRMLLPLGCSQLIQDAFAEMLGVMMVITDMQGRPVTEVSNPCAFFTALTQGNPAAAGHCVRTWQQLAGHVALEPKFSLSEMGLLCARGLIRVGAELQGMVVIGGIAPEIWPPAPEAFAALAHTFGMDPTVAERSIAGVYCMDRATQARALRFVQRIADIFSHIADDRGTLQGRLQAISALTAL